MPSDATNAAVTPRPSIFLSYASEDRAAARALRDTLAEAGLDVWLDEDELGGGEAWDAKIRNQIRTCTYFMPVISATTEVRREGYFRREWRFAVERTLDLADDVMFLVPVVIDETRDAGARVPEKFFSVQWLRVPAGQATPGLRELAGKLANGETVAVHHSAPATAAPVSRAERKAARAEKAPPPPFPHFPAFPEKGQLGRFVYELALWAGRLVHALWGHLPRFIQIIAAIAVIFNLISWISRDRPRSAEAKAEKAALVSDVNKVVESAVRGAKGEGKGATPEMVQSIVGAVAAVAQSGRPLSVVPFNGEGELAVTYADAAFDAAYEILRRGGPDQVSLSPVPLDNDFSDTEALLRGAQLKSRFVLTGQVSRESPEQPLKLTVKLYEVKQPAAVWTESYDISQVDAPTAARNLTAEVSKRIALP